MAGWLDSVVGALQSGYTPGMGASPFPDYVPPAPPLEGQALWDKIAADEAAANAAADRRNVAGMTRGPIANPADALSALSEPAISMALGGGMQPPANPSAPFGAIPPSLAMAKAETAPPPPQPDQAPMSGPVPMPMPRPVAADAPPATDMSSQARPGPAPMGLAPPPAAAPMMPQAAPEPSFGDRMKSMAPALLAAGSALQGDNSVAAGMMKQREALAMQAQQNNATARLLAARGARPAEIQAAISGGPEAIKALLGEYLGKDKWKIVKAGQDENGRETYVQQNEMDGTVRPIPGGVTAGPTRNTVMGPDGKPIEIPPGVDRKEFIKRISQTAADAASGKMTETQAKASSYVARMQKAESSLAGLQNEGRNLWGKIASEVPGGNYLQSDTYQKYKQAASSFITAVLRQESGAAISKTEFERYEKEFFPQPGDSDTVVQQKAQARAAAIEQMQRAAGPAYAAHAAHSPVTPAADAKPGAVKPGAYVWDPVKGLVPK